MQYITEGLGTHPITVEHDAAGKIAAVYIWAIAFHSNKALNPTYLCKSSSESANTVYVQKVKAS